LKNAPICKKAAPNEEMGYLNKDFNDVKESGWLPKLKISKDESVFTSIKSWSDPEAKTYLSGIILTIG